MSNEARIELKAKRLGEIPGKGEYYHLYYVKTDSNGKQTRIDGLPSKTTTTASGALVEAATGDTDNGTLIFNTNNYERNNDPSVVVATGSDEDINNSFEKLTDEAHKIEDANYDYNALYKNSNSGAYTMAKATNLPFQLPKDANGEEVWAPGYDHDLNDPLFLTDPASYLEDMTLDAFEAFYNGFGSAQGAFVEQPRRDPITVDLDNDGIETIGKDESKAYFDLDGNGTIEKTSWIKSDDGFIVMDRNANGTIDNGRELFGDATILKTGRKASTGFEALAEQDTNADGVIDKNDENFSNLRVWRDYNQNGISEANELETLEEERIEKIHLDYLTVNADDGKGNIQTRTSGFEFTDGSMGLTGEFLFDRNVIDTQNNDFSDVSAEIKSLPYMRGFGEVTDLYHAMEQDSVLKTMVEEFAGYADQQANSLNYNNIGTTLKNKFEEIVFRWAGSDTIDSTSRGGNIDARRFAVLEKFFAEGFEGFGAVGTAERSSNTNAAAA
ncbi:MAG: hypothetical protein WCR55_10330 [Lentisphaerota bacterium]